MSDDDRTGEQLPDPDERPCDECGHVWFAGERHHGYIDRPDDPDDVIVLCALCRRQRLMTPRREPEPRRR